MKIVIKDMNHFIIRLKLQSGFVPVLYTHDSHTVHYAELISAYGDHTHDVSLWN